MPQYYVTAAYRPANADETHAGFMAVMRRYVELHGFTYLWALEMAERALKIDAGYVIPALPDRAGFTPSGFTDSIQAANGLAAYARRLGVAATVHTVDCRV